MPFYRYNRLTLALSFALASTLTLSACGGAGGGTRKGPPLTNVCTDPNANNTGASSLCFYSPAPPQVCNDPKANNFHNNLPCTYNYSGTKDNLLIPSHVAAAHAEGFTGKGVTVGMVDVAFNYAQMDYAPLNGKVLSYDTALTNYGWKDGTPNLHFQLTAANLAGGRPIGNFNGGVAPDARLRWFGVCSTAHQNCKYDQLKSAHYVQTLLNYGDVRLINASMVSNNKDFRGYWEPLLEHDALLVASAGNDNKAQPGAKWQVPLTEPEYYGHFIVAMAVHAYDLHTYVPEENISTDPSYRLTRASYSNACGVAKEWCVGAVSNTQIPGYNNPYQPQNGAGTSVAAPVVTGVAALVMEAYPWMSALNVQQTVLTTATDIGAPGVDEVYGWGLVNAAKAIHGPAQFVKNQFINGFIADLDNGSRPFSNDISGAGWLRKRGNGTLTLTGKNTYTGGTFVEAGTLRSSGSFGSSVEVSAGATFMTAGTGAAINGHYTVHSAASWNAGRPVSDHKPMATTAIQLGAPLTITGWADIGNRSSRLLLLQETQGYLVKSTETLITTGQGLSGQFSEVNYGSNFFWDAKLNYDSHTLTADLSRASAQSQATASHASAQVIEGAAMADTLISYTDALVESGQTAGHEALLAATAKLMAAPDNATAARSLASLTGEIHGAARALGIQRTFDNGEHLADRLRTLGKRQQTGIWLQNNSNNGSVNRMGYGQAEVQHSISGIGADATLGEHWTLGMAVARTTSNAHLEGLSGRLNGNGQQMAVYARTHLGNQGYFSSLMSFDEHTIDTQRQVLAGGHTPNLVSGQHIDRVTLVRLENGVNLKTGFAPYWAMGTLSLRQSGFTESGLLGLSASSDTFSTKFAEIGTRFDRHLGRWTLAANTSARRMRSSDTGFNAAFAGAETAPFTVAGQSLNGTHVRMGSELSYQALNGWQLSMGLGSQYSNGQKRKIWGEAAARISF